MDKKFEKKQEKSRRKMLIEEYREENPYIPTDEEILENNSYWDIDYLEEVNAKTNKGIKLSFSTTIGCCRRSWWCAFRSGGE